LHMRLDGMSKGGKAARPWSMRLATAGRELKPQTCEPQSNCSLDELATTPSPLRTAGFDRLTQLAWVEKPDQFEC
jgi:hypothetical protein